jgi:biotin carboxyl carrier protein
MKPRSTPLAAALVAVVACGGRATPSAASVPATIDVCPSQAPVAAPIPPAAPGERWLTAAQASSVRFVEPWAPTGWYLAAAIDVDEQHVARVHSLHSGTVASIAVQPETRVKRDDVLLTIDDGSHAPKPVRSPIAGEVTAISVKMGDGVAGTDRDPRGATLLVVVNDVSDVIATAGSVPPGVLVGSPVELRVDAYPNRVFMTAVGWIELDHSRFGCHISNPDHSLSPGTHGTLFVAQAGLPGLLVPRAAIVPGRSSVLLKTSAQPAGRVVVVETPVTIVFDGGAGPVRVSGLPAATSLVANVGELSASSIIPPW